MSGITKDSNNFYWVFTSSGDRSVVGWISESVVKCLAVKEYMPKRIEVSLDLLDTELESPKMRQVSLGLVLLVSEFLLGSGNNICHRYTGDISLYIYILPCRPYHLFQGSRKNWLHHRSCIHAPNPPHPPAAGRVLDGLNVSPYPQFASSRHYLSKGWWMVTVCVSKLGSLSPKKWTGFLQELIYYFEGFEGVAFSSRQGPFWKSWAQQSI